MSNGLAGKKALVTGASGGIGAGIAKAFGAGGARVAVHYRTRKSGAEATLAAISNQGGEAFTCYADLRSESAIERLLGEVYQRWGGLDILVNNAGIVLKSSILDTDASYWDDLLNINLRAPYLLSWAVAKRMADAGNGGCILHNTSIHAKNSTQYFSAYAASKAALEMLAKVQALEWAEYGIRVNCVAPGVVPVERTQEMLEKAKDAWLPHIPLSRYGTVDEIADLSVYLCGERAGWITGQSFAADGGMLSRIDMPRRPKPPPAPPPDSVDEH